MNRGAKMISSALLGLDVETILINNKAYVIAPPTIGKLAAAGRYLSDIGDGQTMTDVLMTISTGAEGAAKALSCLIKGDESLYKEFKEATLDEIVAGLEKAFGLISAENFIRLSALMRNVANLIARPK